MNASIDLHDAEAQFRAFAEERGLLLPPVLVTGKIDRCPVEGKPRGQDGSYTFHTNDRPAGYVKNFTTGVKENWRYESPDGWTPPAPTPEEARERAKRAKEEAAKREREQKEAIAKAYKLWQFSYNDAAGHPYLTLKRVKAFGDIRRSGDHLVLPWRDIETDELMTVQTIAPNGDKRWFPGAPKRGAFTMDGDVAEPLFICEGYATGATLYEALGRKRTVLCAGDATSIVKVAEAERRKWPERGIFIATDDDHKTALKTGRNPGLDAARAAVAAGFADGVLAPPRDVLEQCGGSDWNDYFVHVLKSMGEAADADEVEEHRAKALDTVKYTLEHAMPAAREEREAACMGARCASVAPAAAPVTSLVVPVTSLDTPGTSLVVPASPTVDGARAYTTVYDSVIGAEVIDTHGVSPRDTPPSASARASAAAQISSISFEELKNKKFTPQKWIVPGIIPSGLTILFGAPKTGKSILTLELALAVATGGLAWGNIRVEPGDVLYCGLEDTERRIKSRVEALGYGEYDLSRADLVTTLPRQEEGGLDYIEGWLDAHPDARLVVIDTLARFRTHAPARQNAYDADSLVIARIADLAKSRDVAIISVSHTRKTKDGDFIQSLTGSTGISGSADVIIKLQRTRLEGGGGELLCTGRDINEAKYNLTLDGCRWIYQGEALEKARGEREEAIYDYLAEVKNASLGDIAKALGKKTTNIANVVSNLVKKDLIEKVGYGIYHIRE